MSYFEAKEIDQEIRRKKGGYIEVKPPNTRSSVQKPINLETAWSNNVESLKAGAFGAPIDPRTMLRYWSAQAAAGYPYAEENVKYFTVLTGKARHEQGMDHIASVLQHIKKYLHDILDEWHRQQYVPNFYELNIGVYNHVRKELDDLYAFAEKLGIKLDEEGEADG